MDRSALEAEVGRLLNDPNHDRWSTAVIDSRLDMAQTYVQAFVNAVKTKETLTPTANTAEVSLNANTIDITRVRWTFPNGDKRKLEGMSRIDLDFYHPNWENWTAGEPKTWFFDPSNAQLVIVPAPDAIHAITNALDVWEVRNPASLSSSSSIPFDSASLMAAFHMPLVHWTVAQCFMDNATPESLSLAKFHRSGSLQSPGEFENQMKLLLDKWEAPEDIPTSVKWKPQGGRIGGWSARSKSSPLG